MYLNAVRVVCSIKFIKYKNVINMSESTVTINRKNLFYTHSIAADSCTHLYMYYY